MAELGHGAVHHRCQQWFGEQWSWRGVSLSLRTASEKLEETMSRFRISLALLIALLFASVGIAYAGQYGTAEEAKTLLEKAVAAVKQDKAKALDMFNKGEDGFKDRDLYVSCANASDGIVTAHPYMKGEQLKDIKGKKGYPLGQEMMQKATEGEIKQVTYWWPRPGSDKPLEKTTFYTKVGDQICSVGYYKD
jgi:Single Cache domain 2